MPAVLKDCRPGIIYDRIMGWAGGLLMPLIKYYSEPKVGDVKYYIFGNPDPLRMTMMVVDVLSVSTPYFQMAFVKIRDVIIDYGYDLQKSREPNSAFNVPWERLVDTPQKAKRGLVHMIFSP